MQTILILKGRHDPLQLIDAIAPRWACNGYRVLTHHGYQNPPLADIAILHVDLTEIPAVYPKSLRAYPLVLNRNVPQYFQIGLQQPDRQPAAMLTTAGSSSRPTPTARNPRSPLQTTFAKTALAQTPLPPA